MEKWYIKLKIFIFFPNGVHEFPNRKLSTWWKSKIIIFKLYHFSINNRRLFNNFISFENDALDSISHLRKIKKKIRKNLSYLGWLRIVILKSRKFNYVIKHNRLFEYSYGYRGGKSERKSESRKERWELQESREKATGSEYHLSSGCLPVKQAANAIQFAWWKASLLSFLPSSSNEPRPASYRHSSALLTSFLLLSSLLPPYFLLSSTRPFTIPHRTLCIFLLPPSLFPPFFSFYLELFLLSRNAPRIRLDQRFPMPSFPRREAFSFFRISRPLRCPRITRKRRGWSDLKCSDSARR